MSGISGGGPGLSVVIPAYNEARRLPATVERVASYLAGREGGWEIVVVDDGSRDDTGAAALQADPSGRLRVLRNARNRGKGYAVRRGMLESRGARVLFSDADLSTPIDNLERLEAKLNDGFDIAIGSRAVRGSVITKRQPLFRVAMGKSFNLFMRACTGLPFHDTQCGFKLFSRAAADTVFGSQAVDGFGFDVEAMAIAVARGLRVAEVAVEWCDSPDTRVHVLRDPMTMAGDVLRIGWRRLAGRL